jgi:hypothetical protein
MTKKVNTATLLVVLLSASLANAQATGAKHSAVGVWKLDLTQSTFPSAPPVKSVTLTILEDTPDAMAWRWEGVDATGKSNVYSWSGPTDGSMQDLKDGDGQPVAKESVKREGDLLLRHGEIANVQTMDGRGTFSADGTTFTLVDTTKTQDGKTSTTTTVFHRVAGAQPASK